LLKTSNPARNLNGRHDKSNLVEGKQYSGAAIGREEIKDKRASHHQPVEGNDKHSDVAVQAQRCLSAQLARR